MFQTKITEMLNIQYPIIGGAMMYISKPEFVAAVSNAGGLGVLASAIYQDKDEFGEALDRLKALTDKPFAVNLNLFPAMRPIDNNDYMDVMIEKGVNIVETSGHAAPEDLCGRFKDAGMTWIHKCVGVRYAMKVQELGANIVTVVGYENGGATGKLDLGTLALVPRVVDAVDLPVIAGGGVADGRGFLAVLAMGAEGVIIGTRIMATKEAPLHDRVKQALIGASELDTMLIMRSINSTHRVWVNEASKKCVEVEGRGGGLNEILEVVSGQKAKKMYDEGDLDVGIMSCGQCVGLVQDIPTVKDLFDRIVSQAETMAKKLSV